MRPPPSDHFNGKRFFNPGQPAERGLIDLLRWKIFGHAVKWPRRVDFTQQEPPARPAFGITVTWIGQSTFLLQTPQANFLTDPIFSERASPVNGMGPQRAMAPGLEFDQLPKIDAVLLSHDHFDHCDLPTLHRLKQAWAPTVIAPLGHASLLTRNDAAEAVVELDWWQTHVPAASTTVELVPARHWCRRRPFGANLRLWGGFMLRAGGRLLYFVGDSGYDAALFGQIGARCGRPDLMLIPIGAYEPRWFMQGAHMNPAEAVRVHRDMGAHRSIAMHWGTFPLTDEGREDPPRALEAARKNAGIPSDQFLVLAPGGSAEA